MKSSKIFAILLLSIAFVVSNAQQTTQQFGNYFVAATIDPGTSIYGSDYNKPAVDAQLRFYVQTNHVEVGIQLEHFQAIEYNNFLVSVGYYQNLNRFQLAAYPEVGMIIREYQFSYLTYGVNGEVRYKLSNRFGATIKGNYQHRPDFGDSDKYGRYSTYVGLIYQLK